MSVAVPELLTVGDIAERNDKPLHRVLYVLKTRDIAPIARAGNTRLFDVAAADRVASEIRRIDAEREEIGL